MTGRLIDIEIDETDLPAFSVELGHERRVAIFDLLEANTFALVGGPEGPYRLRLGLNDDRIAFDVMPVGAARVSFVMALGTLDQAVKDYTTLCGSYAEAVKTLPPARIEMIDTVRRDIHSEAASQLQRRLTGKARMDAATARRLFTLICALIPQN